MSVLYYITCGCLGDETIDSGKASGTVYNGDERLTEFNTKVIFTIILQLIPLGGASLSVTTIHHIHTHNNRSLIKGLMLTIIQ